jgi:hypothetical protein
MPGSKVLFIYRKLIYGVWVIAVVLFWYERGKGRG